MFSKRGLNMIEGNEEEGEGTSYDEMENVNGNSIENGKVKEFGLSLNVLADSYAHNTIQIKEGFQRR